MNLISQTLIGGGEGCRISSAVGLCSRWSPLCQCYCVNTGVRGRTFANNMNIFLDNTQLHWIQWIYLINPIISFERGFPCPLVSSFLTQIGVFVPGCQGASLRGCSPSQGDCYDHVLFVPTSGCGGEIVSESRHTHTHTEKETQKHTLTNTHLKTQRGK